MTFSWAKQTGCIVVRRLRPLRFVIEKKNHNRVPIVRCRKPRRGGVSVRSDGFPPPDHQPWLRVPSLAARDGNRLDVAEHLLAATGDLLPFAVVAQVEGQVRKN